MIPRTGTLDLATRTHPCACERAKKSPRRFSKILVETGSNDRINHPDTESEGSED